MSSANKPSVYFASLSFELAADASAVPSAIKLLPSGEFRANDGRPAECGAWRIDAALAAKVIARVAQRKVKMVIDYEHQSLRAIDNGQKVIAAGWIPNSLEWREGDGLYATNITWTKDARREIAELKIRYISPVFYYNANGEVLDIASVALTNTPALDDLGELARAALSRGDFTTHFSTTTGDAEMAQTDQQVAALTAERDVAKQALAILTTENTAIKTQLAALTTENTAIKTQLAALTTENTTLKSEVEAVKAKELAAAAAAEKTKHGELLQAALSKGLLLPAQKPWAEKQSLTALTEYLDATDPVALLNKQAGGKLDAGDFGLSQVELAECTKMRVNPEDFAKAKADLAKKRAVV